MKLYNRLENHDLVENYKEFSELIHIRAIYVNNKPVDNPNFEVVDTDKIKVGILDLESKEDKEK